MSDLSARTELLRQIEEDRGSKVVLYATGDRGGLETRIGQDVIDLFVDHLDEIGPVPKISLVLYTSGGSTSAAWNLVNLIRMFCDDFEVVTPSKCMSAGTLISLGAEAVNGYLDAVRTSNGGTGHEEKALLDLSDKVGRKPQNS